MLMLPFRVMLILLFRMLLQDILDMTYNSSLAAIVPAASSFVVLVNSVARNVSAVAVSGTKVSLTLASPVIKGDVVTVSYTKPATNPLQTVTGGQAVSISGQLVNNNVNAPIPVYVSSAIQDVTPGILDMTYSLTLAPVVPATSSFVVLVNSVARTVNAIAVSGTKVTLTLASPVFIGDIITVSYTKPATNPLQTATGGLTTSISSQAVINNVITQAAIPGKIAMTVYPNPAHRIINISLVYTGTFSGSNAITTQSIRIAEYDGQNCS